MKWLFQGTIDFLGMITSSHMECCYAHLAWNQIQKFRESKGGL